MLYPAGQKTAAQKRLSQGFKRQRKRMLLEQQKSNKLEI